AQDAAEGLGLLRRDHRLARVAADDLLAPEAGRALAGVVEEQDDPVRVEHAHERLCRLCERSREDARLDGRRARDLGIGHSGRGYRPRASVTLVTWAASGARN